MKNLRTLFLLLAIATLATSCTKPYGQDYALSLYRSETEATYEQVKADLAKYLTTHGLTESPMPAFQVSDFHETGNKDTLYTIPVGGNQLYLCITINDAQKEINATTMIHGKFTERGIAEMKRRNAALLLDLAGWVETNAKENEVGGGSAKWFGQSRAQIKQTFAQ